MKLPRTLRMDPSDARVFELAADPGEWAVAGTFMFVDRQPAEMDRKTQLAFKSGWLGIASFGWSTFVQVTVASDEAAEATVRDLAAVLHARFGAPDMLAAVDAARNELAHASSLSDHPAGTLLAIEREMTEDGIREIVKIVPRPDDEGGHARIWTFVPEDEG